MIDTGLRLLSDEYGGVDRDSAARASDPGRDYYYNILMKSADDVAQTIKESGGECFAWEADLANAVVFFASKQADWITGQVLQVGGGNRM